MHSVVQIVQMGMRWTAQKRKIEARWGVQCAYTAKDAEDRDGLGSATPARRSLRSMALVHGSNGKRSCRCRRDGSLEWLIDARLEICACRYGKESSVAEVAVSVFSARRPLRSMAYMRGITDEESVQKGR